ncbi:hypothetical protein [Micromonospora palomenae]|uniref:hypothetical protein n=1 Tax=Micromonospora palomenae TaxID=1461247 RepID=UPI003F8A10B7
MLNYVRWYCLEADRWNYDELDADGWAVRHVEVRAAGGVILAAASLAEVLAARDSGGAEAVRRYERQYGVVPEAPLPQPGTGVEPPVEEIAAEDFEKLWRVARRHLD